jgi:uncharacterized membrane protein YecN with MAPEG domain
MLIVALYAAILALLFVALSVRTLRLRRRLQIAIGDGHDKAMLRAMRVHANFAEYVPFAIVLMALAESMEPPDLLVHVAGVLLVIGRLIHAYGVSQSPPIMKYRVYGMWLTFASMTLAALLCLALSTFFLIV